MTTEQLIARFTRHPHANARQDKSGSAHVVIAAAAAQFALALFEAVPSRPENEEAVRNALAHIDSAVDCAVEAVEDRAAEPVVAAPVFATHEEAGTDDRAAAGSRAVEEAAAESIENTPAPATEPDAEQVQS